MNRRLLLKAAMRSADVGHLADQIQRLAHGGIDALHFDVMDGRFVPEICFGPLLIQGLRKYTSLPFEIHLLVDDPDGCLHQYLDAGADCVLIHIETSRDPVGMLTHIRHRGCQVGLALVPGTSAQAVEPYLGLCDVVNVMTVIPGKPGVLSEAGVQSLSVVARLVNQRGGRQLVQADGAVSLATRDQFLREGARALVVGHPIFSREDFGEAIEELRRGQGSAQDQAVKADTVALD